MQKIVYEVARTRLRLQSKSCIQTPFSNSTRLHLAVGAEPLCLIANDPHLRSLWTETEMRKNFLVLAVAAVLGSGYAAAIFVPDRLLQLLEAVAGPGVSVTDQLMPPEAIILP